MPSERSKIKYQVGKPDRTSQLTRGAYELGLEGYLDDPCDLIELVIPTRPETDVALALYETKCAEFGSFPKSQIMLKEIAPFARTMWMVTHHPEDDAFRVTLWSSGTVDLTGLELTGEIVSEDGANKKWAEAYRRVMAENTPMVVRNKLSEMGKKHITAEIALLPITTGQGSVTSIMCAYSVLPLKKS